ncbi:ubiquitin carboxyl-terminal hydrolase 37-like isoform X2 [Solea senegalensis]|uniref:Ubiquitin carboxyl-terminal hydrolase 37-like isoform X2 n=1 Tax=Solea senegalensis TaxID=28829 RepID=A0AAV6SQL8_SOLSE|nr:ubiquitin carboxyl-terminal hydrolase 37-like isoform X2 [Solea senegalensis]
MTAFLYQKSPAVVDDVAIKERQFLSYQKSVFTDKAPAANKENKLSWGSRLFGQNKENHEKQKQSILTSAHKKTHETKEQKKLSWWKRFKNRSQVSSAPREQREPEKKRISNTQRHTREAQDEAKATAGSANRRENTSRCKRLFRLGVEKENTPRNEKQSFTISTNPNKKMLEKPIRCLRSEVIPTTLELLIPERRCRSTFAKQTTVEVKGTEPVPPINPPKKIIRMPENLLKEEHSTEELCPSTSLPHRSKTPRQQQFRNRGLPNPAMFCYMNSCLQSLLTLKDFVRDMGSQELVQALIPETKLMRSFLDISKFHFSDDTHKMELLHAFKSEVALQNPEFCDHQQKDAHEFLIAVLEQMRKLGKKAVKMGQDYRCPVTKHMMFKMRNTRTCKTCGAKSERLELFSNLSLDLTPGATVKQLLNNYRREMELDYKCDCGACTSVQRSTFATLPKVLILQLKRFKFTEDLEVTKVYDNIILQRELHLSSRKGAVSYMLVSCISHLSSSARIGHYICDGVYPDAGQADLADLWHTYDDSFVRETCGASVCKLRGEYAYILFYQRQD